MDKEFRDADLQRATEEVRRPSRFSHLPQYFDEQRYVSILSRGGGARRLMCTQLAAVKDALAKKEVRRPILLSDYLLGRRVVAPSPLLKQWGIYRGLCAGSAA